MKKETGTHDTRSNSNDAAPIGEETHEVGLTGTYTDLLGKQSEFFRCNPNVLGGGDILFITVGEPVARAGLLASLLAGIATDDGKRVIQKYLMVLPTETDLSAANTLAWNYFKSGFKRLAGRKMEAKESAWFRARFEV